MEITNELLAAYAEGNVSESERNAVRQYLTDNPDELETLMIMMDEDYELEIENETEGSEEIAAPNDDLFSDICYSAAAFAPRRKLKKKTDTSRSHQKQRIGFNQLIDELLDELDH